MLGDRNFAVHTISGKAFAGFAAGVGCLWLIAVGIALSAAGLVVLALAKYVFGWSPF